VALAVLLTLIAAGGVPPQKPPAPAEDARVQAALAAIERTEPATLAAQVRLCEVPAPPFGERARAVVLRDIFHAAGLRNVRIDREGNVVGERPGRSPQPNVVLAAHLDTVFPAGTDVTVTRRGAVLRGPGIGDNCRGLAVLAAVAKALNAAGVTTDGSITFVATVGEEGLGDLRGVKTLVAETLKGRIDYFVAIDGSGSSITNVGVGSRRYRVVFRGPGGHSYDNFGRANPANALGRAIARISDLQVPAKPRTTFNIGRIGGGTAVNAIPQEAWMEVDLRSSDQAVLDELDKSVHQAVTQAAALENLRWKTKGDVTVTVERVGDRPGGRSDESSRIVQAAVAASKALMMPAPLVENSTDANVPMSLGIPAISVGAGGRGADSHSVAETFDSTDSTRGSARLLLLALSLSRR
jgi:acetylornithine deacetylase/succinyl-diaminopimelate desuccinylase-like protein